MMEEGQRAPDCRLELAGGGFRTLDELLADGPVLLAFYKVTCPTCQLALPYLARLEGGPIRVVAVCQDSAERARDFADAFEVELENLFDTAGAGYPASNAFGVAYVPSMYLVEPDRLISWACVGFHRSKLEQLAARAGRVMFSAGDRAPESKPG